MHERLFEEAATRRARIREESEGAELRGCTFKPQVRVDPGVAAELWSTPHTVLVHMCLLALPVQVSNRARSLQVSGDRLDMMYREGKSKLYAKRHAQVGGQPLRTCFHGRAATNRGTWCMCSTCDCAQEYNQTTNPDPKDLEECTFHPHINTLPYEAPEEVEQLKKYIEPVSTNRPRWVDASRRLATVLT